MKRVLNLIVVIGFVATAFQAQSQVTSIAWTGINGNLVANSAAGSVSYNKYGNSELNAQGGSNNSSGVFATTGLNELSIPQLEKFTVYPNPTTGVVSGVPAGVTVSVFNLSGQVVYSSDNGQIDLTDVMSGTYIIQAYGYETVRVIKY